MATVLVLGASGHVGTAVARRLLRDHDVIGTRFSSAGVAPIRWLDVDLRDPAALTAALDRLDAVPDVLVHCAGLGEWTELADLSLEAWDDVMNVGVRAPFVAAQWLAQRWQPGCGRIVAITAMPGITTVPAPPHTAAANAALAGMMRALANELGPRKIAVHSVMLGPLEGGLGAAIPTRLRVDYERFNCLKRCGTAAEAAEVVAFCVAAPLSMTGAVIAANGGL